MAWAQRPAMRLYSALVALLLLSSCPGESNARGLFSLFSMQQQQPAPPDAAAGATSPLAPLAPVNAAVGSSGNTTGAPDAAVDLGSAVTKLFQHTFKNQSLPSLKDIIVPMINASRHRKKNFTWDDLAPDNTTLKQAVRGAFKDALSNITNGMSFGEFAQALLTGTVSSNTADTNTPDKGLSDVQSGAININPFVDGAALSNALTLAGRDATANSRGLVFGMIGTGRASSQATAVGMSGAKASTDTFSVNGGGVSQNAMSANLALTPHGRADTSVRAGAFNMLGHTATGGLTNAIGKKGAAAAGLGAGMTGFGESYSSQFINSFSPGDTSSSTGVLAGTLTGAAKATIGAVSTSLKKSADSQSISTSKSALGSATSKSASLSTAAQNATSNSGSVASTGVGNVASIASTTSTGMNADATASSNATSQAGAANSKAFSRASGVTSAKSASKASSAPFVSGVRDSPVLWTQRRKQSTTWSHSKATSDTTQGGVPVWSLSSLLPSWMRLPGHGGGGGVATTAPLLGEAFISTVGLKGLLPSVPKITPQLPTLNQTVEINGTANACNETALNWNRTSDMPWLRCNETNTNGTNFTVPTVDGVSGLPGIGFFKNLQDMNDKFVRETRNKSSPAPGQGAFGPTGPPAPAAVVAAAAAATAAAVEAAAGSRRAAAVAGAAGGKQAAQPTPPQKLASKKPSGARKGSSVPTVFVTKKQN